MSYRHSPRGRWWPSVAWRPQPVSFQIKKQSTVPKQQLALGRTVACDLRRCPISTPSWVPRNTRSSSKKRCGRVNISSWPDRAGCGIWLAGGGPADDGVMKSARPFSCPDNRPFRAGWWMPDGPRYSPALIPALCDGLRQVACVVAPQCRDQMFNPAPDWGEMLGEFFLGAAIGRHRVIVTIGPLWRWCLGQWQGYTSCASLWKF